MGSVRAFILLESSIQTADTWYRIPPRSGRGGGFEKQRSLLTHGQNTDCVNLTKRSATRRGALMDIFFFLRGGLNPVNNLNGRQPPPPPIPPILVALGPLLVCGMRNLGGREVRGSVSDPAGT